MTPVKRLASTKEISRVLKARTKLHSNVLTLFFLKQPNLKEVRVVLIVSKKVSLKAVERNKIKRQLKAILNKMDLHDKAADLAIIIKPEFMQNTFLENQKILNKLVNKIFAGGS